MNRRFNSTGRKRIGQDMIALRVIEDPSGGPARFTADLSGLADLELQPDARVIVEPYFRQSSMRFDFGNLGEPCAPVDTRLSEIDRDAAVQFRIKIVDTHGRPGRLLALGDRIRPHDEKEDDSRKSILPLVMTDLGEAVWKTQVGLDEAPQLLINKRIPSLRTRLDEDPLLRGAIFPTAVREVMRVVLSEDVSNEMDWVGEWREFAESLIGEALPDDPPEAEAAEALVERVVGAFTTREKWATTSLQSASTVEPDYE